MKCTCPKCRAEIELHLPEVTEKGCPTTCTACKARLYVHRESFGGRAYRMTGDISCAQCGMPLGPDTYCYKCGALYPDYLVIAHGTKRAPHPSNKMSATDLILSTERSRESVLSPDAPRQASTKAVSHKAPHGKRIVAALVAVVLVALAGLGFTAYQRNKAEKAYADSFVKLTYCVHSGQSRSLNAATKMAAEWRANGGQGSAPRIDLQEEKDYTTLNAEIEKLKSKMVTPPEKYRQCHEMLTRLHGDMQKMQSVALSPPSSLPALTDATARLDTEYQKTMREYKSSLPEELTKDLQSASKRYKALQTMFQ